MPDLKAFQQATQRSLNARIFLQNESVRSGTGTIQWIKGYTQRTTNRNTTQSFIKSLKEHYGSEITDYVSEKYDLNKLARSGRSLKSRNISNTIQLADQLKSDFAQSRKSSIESLSKNIAAGVERTPLQIQLDAQVKKYTGPSSNGSQIKKFIDVEKVLSDVDEMTEDDEVFTSTQKISEIVSQSSQEMIRKGLVDKSYAHTSLTDHGSYAMQALNQLGGKSNTPIDPKKLNPATVEKLNRKLRQAVEFAVQDAMKEIDQGKTNVPLLRLAQQKIESRIDTALQGFVDQCQEAREAVYQLPKRGPFKPEGITADQQKILLEFATYQNVEADYIPALARHFPTMKKALGQIADASKHNDKQALHAAMKETYNTLVEITNVKEAYIDPHERSEFVNKFWRFFLTTLSTEQKVDIQNTLGQVGGSHEKLMQSLSYAAHILPELGDADSLPLDVISRGSEAHLIFSGLTDELSNQTGQPFNIDPTCNCALGTLPQEDIDLAHELTGIEIPKVDVDYSVARENNIQNFIVPNTRHPERTPLGHRLDVALKKYFGPAVDLVATRKLINRSYMAEQISAQVRIKEGAGDNRQMITLPMVSDTADQIIREEIQAKMLSQYQSQVGEPNEPESLVARALQQAMQKAAASDDANALAPPAIEILKNELQSIVTTAVSESIAEMDEAATNQYLNEKIEQKIQESLDSMIARL